MPEVDCLSEGVPEPAQQPMRRTGFRHVLACVDATPFAGTIVAHAVAVAEATGARVTVLQVMRPPGPGEVPADPVAWALRRREAETRLADLAAAVRDGVEVGATILEGSAAERICDWAVAHEVDLAVLGTRSESDHMEGGLGSTARRIIERLPASMLLLPPGTAGAGPLRYRRILVPLDCSARAETALPVAVALAAAHEAELILVHASPEVDLVGAGPPEPEDLELRERLRRRNERVAQAYLQQVRARLFSTGGTVRIRLLSGDDPRHAIARAAAEEHADIVVLSSTGTGGHPDLPVGSVADYLINHVATPILVVREAATTRRAQQRTSGVTAGLRLPSQALP